MFVFSSLASYDYELIASYTDSGLMLISSSPQSLVSSFMVLWSGISYLLDLVDLPFGGWLFINQESALSSSFCVAGSI